MSGLLRVGDSRNEPGPKCCCSTPKRVDRYRHRINVKFDAVAVQDAVSGRWRGELACGTDTKLINLDVGDILLQRRAQVTMASLKRLNLLTGRAMARATLDQSCKLVCSLCS